MLDNPPSSDLHMRQLVVLACGGLQSMSYLATCLRGSWLALTHHVEGPVQAIAPFRHASASTSVILKLYDSLDCHAKLALYCRTSVHALFYRPQGLEGTTSSFGQLVHCSQIRISACWQQMVCCSARADLPSNNNTDVYIQLMVLQCQ